MEDRIPYEIAASVCTIERPPCLDCKNWRPVVTQPYIGRGFGIRLCHALAMQPDFSCFEPKPEA